MATNLPFCFFIQFLEHLLKFLANFALLKYVKSQRSYGFLITKELIIGFQILDLKDHFSASLKIKDNLVSLVTHSMTKSIIWIVEDSGELTKAQLKYAVNKVFQNDRHQCFWAETLHQG